MKSKSIEKSILGIAAGHSAGRRARELPNGSLN